MQVASRALTFLQNTVGELKILDVSVAPGGVACWGVLSCLEVTDGLHRYHTTEAHALHTAPLWAYARDKVCVCVCRGGVCVCAVLDYRNWSYGCVFCLLILIYPIYFWTHGYSLLKPPLDL